MNVTVYLRNGRSFVTDYSAPIIANLLSDAERREPRSGYGAETVDGYVPFYATDVERIEVDL